MTQVIDGITIRHFEAKDKDIVWDFFGQMGGETRAFFDRNNGNRDMAMKFFDNTAKDTNYFLAEYEGKMVGYLFLWDMDRTVPWLGIAVHEEFKGKQIGRKLMLFATDFVRSKNKGGILLTTHVANLRGQALYERVGYERLGMHHTGEILYLLRF